MSATRHLDDAEHEVIRLARDIDDLRVALLAGQPVRPSDLAHLSRIVTFISAQTAMAIHDLERVPQAERREVAHV
jgi:hypothetical protein